MRDTASPRIKAQRGEFLAPCRVALSAGPVIGHAGGACQYGHLPRSLRVSRSGILAGRQHDVAPVAQETRKTVLVRKLEADICHLPKARSARGHDTGLAYHLHFYSDANLQTLLVTAYATGTRRLVCNGHTAVAYQTNNRFWSLLGQAVGVPEQRLFPPAGDPSR